jgi:hydrogenase maturation protease
MMSLMTKESTGKILVLGFGSDALSDDGLPLKIVKDLEELFPGELISFQTSAVGGIDLVEILDGYETAIFVDTVRTSKGNPGELHILEYPDFMETFHLSSQHDLTFEEALRLGHELGFHLPSKMILIAVEISENRLLRQSFSEIIQDSYPDIIAPVKALIMELF